MDMYKQKFQMIGGENRQFSGKTYDNSKIFVGGLSWQTRKDGLTRYFGRFGEILEAVVVTDNKTGKSKGYGFVLFKDPAAASRACQDPSPLIDGRRVTCNFAGLAAQKETTPRTLPPYQPDIRGIPPLPYRTSDLANRPRDSAYHYPALSYRYSPYPLDHMHYPARGTIRKPYIDDTDSWIAPLNTSKLLPHSNLSEPPRKIFDDFVVRNHHDIRTEVFPSSQSLSHDGVFPQRPHFFGFSNEYVQTERNEVRRHTNSYIPFKFLVMAKNLELNTPARDNNFVFSPCSIHLALSLVANGSNGSTLKQLLTFLEAKDLKNLNSVATEMIDILTGGSIEKGPKLSFVGGLWVDQSMTLQPRFKYSAQNIYRARAKTVDFQNNIKVVIDEVNKWAAASTNGLIKSILPPTLSNFTKSVLANAMYFRGTWAEKFDKRCTKESAFYLQDRSYVLVPFMSSYEEQYITTFHDFKVLRLPYRKGRNSKAVLSMYIILPNQVDGIWRLIERIGTDPSFFQTHLPVDYKVTVGDFRLPKFKMAFDFEASDVLKSIGLDLPFSNNAEFEEMVAGNRLKIYNVIHKAHIEVNEEGTEAAAVTALGVGYASGPLECVDFVADHPFLFMVRDDQTGMVLFMGHIINPLF